MPQMWTDCHPSNSYPNRHCPTRYWDCNREPYRIGSDRYVSEDAGGTHGEVLYDREGYAYMEASGDMLNANTDGANATSQERSARSRSYPREAHAIRDDSRQAGERLPK
jgi:hypothetical protein